MTATAAGHPAVAASSDGAAIIAAKFPDLSDFGLDPWWLMLVKAVAVFAFLVLTVLAAILIERKIMAYMQNRVGPNRWGPWGSLQSLADGIKLALKEGIVPAMVDRPVYFLAPIISVVPAIMAFAVVPFGPEVSIAGHRTPLQLTDLPVAVLYVLAVTSVGVYGIVLAGWSSGSTYPLLGGLRSTAQVISYEIAMGLTFAAVFLAAGTMSTSEIIAAQGRFWYVLLLFPSFVIYLISMVGETNRAPFDLPEAEGELVGGFHTEYSSLRFAMFMLAEYVNMTTVSALAITMFLGGWQAPWPLSLWSGANGGWWPLLWFVIKVWVLLFLFIWLRSTLPRFRYDQFMNLGWKVLIPAALLWVMLVAVYKALRDHGQDGAAIGLIVCGIAVALLVALTARRRYAAQRAAVRAGEERRPGRAQRRAPVHVPRAAGRPDPAAGGFPVPPLPGRRSNGGRAPAAPTSGTGKAAAPSGRTGATAVTGKEERDE